MSVRKTTRKRVLPAKFRLGEFKIGKLSKSSRTLSDISKKSFIKLNDIVNNSVNDEIVNTDHHKEDVSVRLVMTPLVKDEILLSESDSNSKLKRKKTRDVKAKMQMSSSIVSNNSLRSEISLIDLEDEIKLDNLINLSKFCPTNGSTPFNSNCVTRRSSLSSNSSVCDVIDELERTADKLLDDQIGEKSRSGSVCDIDDLLVSDDEDYEERIRSKKNTFMKEEIVWELWYHNNKKKGKVLDEDLVKDGPNKVMAQLCVVSSIQKSFGGRTRLGLVPVPGVMDPPTNPKKPGHRSDIKIVRKFGNLIENRQIMESQKFRADYSTLLNQYENVERYLTNHVGLENVPDDEQKSAREFFSLDSVGRCLYLEGLRRMKRGLDKNIPRRNDESFEKSLIREGIYNHLKQEEPEGPGLPNVEVDLKTGRLSPEKEEDYMSSLDSEMLELVSDLSPNWPLQIVNNRKEKNKLRNIITRRRKCRRHELFMDNRQRITKYQITELVRLSNPSFMNLFGSRRIVLDRDVRSALLDTFIYNRAPGMDHKLSRLLDQSSNFGQDYVELVLYPELFISWISGKRSCTRLQANIFYQRVGCIVSDQERAVVLRRVIESSSESDDDDDSCS